MKKEKLKQKKPKMVRQNAFYGIEEYNCNILLYEIIFFIYLINILVRYGKTKKKQNLKQRIFSCFKSNSN